MAIILPNPSAGLSGGKSIKDLMPALFPAVPCPLIPLGNRILVQIASPLETSGGGIHLTKDTRDYQKWSQKLAMVLKLGVLAYKNRDTMAPWPEGNWCEEGDFIRVPQYGGDRVEIAVPEDIRIFEEHEALFATIPDRDAWSKVPSDINPLTMKGWF